MGYTHYFKMDKTEASDAVWKEFCKLIKKIIEASEVSICNGLGEDVPTINQNDVFFNGDTSKDEDYETFHIQRNMVRHNSFCKTGSRPYDVVVVAVLMVAQTLGVLTWSSDDYENSIIKGQKLLDSIG